MTSTKSKTQSKHPTGYIALRTPDDIQKALTRRINRILMDRGEDHHGGQLAALANAWINAAKWKVEVKDVQKLKEDIERLEEQIKQNNGGR